jgi:hypothetical protein
MFYPGIYQSQGPYEVIKLPTIGAIEIHDQRTPNPTALRYLDAICEYAKVTTITYGISDDSAVVAQISSGINDTHGCACVK